MVCKNQRFHPSDSALNKLVRIGSVMGIYYITIHSGLPFTKFHAMLGLLLGEIAATFYYLNLLSLSQKQIRQKPIAQVNTTCKDLLSMACPLTATRLLLTVLHGIENIMIPLCLVRFGLTNTQSLSIYGIYSGMALPMIFFPTVLSNSIAVMLPALDLARQGRRQELLYPAFHHRWLFPLHVLRLLMFLFLLFFQPFDRAENICKRSRRYLHPHPVLAVSFSFSRHDHEQHLKRSW